MPSWHPPDCDSGMVQDDESTIKVHNDANACFFRIPLDYLDVVADLPPKNQWTEHLVIAFIDAANVNRLLNSTVI